MIIGIIVSIYISKRLYRIIDSNLDIKNKSYKPLIIGILIYILVNNIIGIIPYSLTITRRIKYTLILSFILIIGITIESITRRRFGFINKFIPKGINKIMAILIMIIELFSYFLRILTLSIRLTANLTSGHLILMIISTFPLSEYLLIPLIILEIGVSIIQAFVFMLLIQLYLDQI
jgi:ATP synthase subunit 6